MLINGPADLAGAALDGLTRTAGGVTRLPGSAATAIRGDVAEARVAGQVAVISGGGAGHDPAHAGYVGAGMLTAAVTGPLFTPPPPDAVLDAIRTSAGPAGALLIVADQPADRLNFALAAELARADGIDVAVLPVGDDVSRAGQSRRGLAGTVLVQKVAGAAAADGRPLAQVAALARRAAEAVGTMGVALGPCTASVAGMSPPGTDPTPAAAPDTPASDPPPGLSTAPGRGGAPGPSPAPGFGAAPDPHPAPSPGGIPGLYLAPGSGMTPDLGSMPGLGPLPGLYTGPGAGPTSGSGAAPGLYSGPGLGSPPDRYAAPDLSATPDLYPAPDLDSTPDLHLAPDLYPTPGLGAAQGLGFAPGEAEWGPGANGEPGVGRGPIGSAYQVAARLIAAIVEDRGIAPGDRVALLVNGLGASSPTELSIMAEGAVQALESWDVTPVRVWAGNFLTTLDMAGVSLSLLPLDDELLAALDAPATAPAWPRLTVPAQRRPVTVPPARTATPGELRLEDPVRRALEAVAEALISVRDELTALDREAGDGDLGISLALGAAAILAECPAYPGDDGPAAVLRAASGTVRRTVTGVSGALYAILLLRAAAALPATPGPRDWAAALRAGLDGVREATDAEPGDRTMIDALAPAAATFTDRLDAGRPWPEALTAAVDAATTGADATVDLPPRLGRAGHLGLRVLGHPDPGAQAVAIWLRAAATAIHP